jgi:hypothetical protein
MLGQSAAVVLEILRLRELIRGRFAQDDNYLVNSY